MLGDKSKYKRMFHKCRSIYVWIPASLGFVPIYLFHQKHIHPKGKENRGELVCHKNTFLASSPDVETEEKDKIARIEIVDLWRLLPLRMVSRIWGSINNLVLAPKLQISLYKLWATAFGSNLHEMRYALEHYKNLKEFFSRPLKNDVRWFRNEKGMISSPVDGKVMVVGTVEEGNGAQVLEQIKGMRYRLDEFLGEPPLKHRKDGATGHPSKKLFYCVVYLAPGDYHRIHSPVDWIVEERRHFPGKLLSVSPMMAKVMPKLFVQNERLSLIGKWKHGFFSLTSVGATNVGSITLVHEPRLQTNLPLTNIKRGMRYDKKYNNLTINKGEEVGGFNFGSTIVMVFEAPSDYVFSVSPGDRVMVGKGIDGHALIKEEARCKEKNNGSGPTKIDNGDKNSDIAFRESWNALGPAYQGCKLTKIEAM